MNPTQPAPTLWQRIKKVSHTIGDFQARLLLTILYAIFIVPVGIALRFSDDVLQQRIRPEGGSFWQKKRTLDHDLSHARRQG